MDWEAILSGGIAGTITGIIGSYLTYLFNKRIEKYKRKKEIERKKSQLFDFAHDFFSYLTLGKERELCLLLERNVNYGSFFRLVKINPVYRLSASGYVYGCKDTNWEFEINHLESIGGDIFHSQLDYLPKDIIFSDSLKKYHAFAKYIYEKVKDFQLFGKKQIDQLEGIISTNFQPT